MKGTNTYLGFFKPSVLLILISFFAIWLTEFNGHWGIHYSVPGIITLILILMSTHLWKYPPFKWMFWVEDLSGTYEGILRYSYIKDGKVYTGDMKHIKVINQTGYRLPVSSFTYKSDGTHSSKSHNTVMSLKKTNDEQHFELAYSYHNTGSTEQNFASHYGSENLIVIEQDGVKKLSGIYYTNRIPQTKGEFLDMKWVSADTTHKF